MDSPDATHLPVRLAIAILKDRDGKIVLDVPIEGSLDDPKFRIGKVVQRAIVNILEKVATSPFSLLGALFGGGGEELGYQDFAAGSAELTADDTKKLDSLAKGLYERPGLSLEIAGSIDPDGDREGLQRAALDKEIRTRIWMKLRKAEQATNSVDQIVLTPDDRVHWVKKLYGEAKCRRQNHAGTHCREHESRRLCRQNPAAQVDRQQAGDATDAIRKERVEKSIRRQDGLSDEAGSAARPDGSVAARNLFRKPGRFGNARRKSCQGGSGLYPANRQGGGFTLVSQGGRDGRCPQRRQPRLFAI